MQTDSYSFMQWTERSEFKCFTQLIIILATEEKASRIRVSLKWIIFIETREMTTTIVICYLFFEYDIAAGYSSLLFAIRTSFNWKVH